MLRLVEDRNSMFGTPKAVLDFLLIEAKNLIEDETERKDIEQQLRENVEATVEEGEAHSTLGWNNTIRRIMRLYEKYGDSLPPLEELGQWNASGSMAEGGRSSNSPDVERNAPESQSCNVVSGPGSYWDP